MGKAFNQVVTFADLHSIGYRIPSDKIYDIKGVTYDDLSSLDLEYNSNASMKNVAYSRSYYGGVQNLQYDTSGSEINKFSGTFRTDVTYITNTDETSKLVGTFQVPPAAESVFFPSTVIYIKLLPYDGYSYSNFDFSVRLSIRDQRNIYKWSENWTNIAGTSNVDYSQGKSLSFTIPPLTQLEPNDTYYLYLEYKYSGKSGYKLGCYAAFERGSLYFQAYSRSKCVLYSELRKDTLIPIPLTLKEALANDPNFEKVGLRYRYKLNGSWSTVTLWETNPPDYSGSKSYTPDIKLIPVDNSNITADYLQIYCTGLGRKRKNIWTLEKTDGTTITKTFSNVTGSTYSQTTDGEAVKGGYATFLRDLKSITFKVDND